MSSHPTVPCPTDLCKNCHHLIARHEYTFSVVDDYQVCLLSPKALPSSASGIPDPPLHRLIPTFPGTEPQRIQSCIPVFRATWSPLSTSPCLVGEAQLT